MKKYLIMAAVLAFSIIVCLIDAVLQPNYFVKIPIKIVFFLALPMIFFIRNKEDFKDFKSLFVFRKSGIFKSLLLGIAVYAVILTAFLLTRNVFDYSNVTSSLTSGMGITADNFLYVSLYISLFNSFLEEFFFRGFGFMTLKKHTSRKIAYIFNSAVFAVYHIGMLFEMFNIGVLLLLMFGLIVGGCIFNFLNERNDNIYPSWFVHMFANYAINTVGFILFGII